MDDFSHESFCGFDVGVKRDLTKPQLHQLTTAFQSPPQPVDQILGGRRSICKIDLEGVGPVIVKHYRRGGLLAKFITRYYFGSQKTRGQIEFEQMELARSLGCGSPEPVAYAWRGRIFYQAWLVTREVEHAQSLAQIARTSPERTRIAMTALCRQTSILIENSIMHADFHPGNVLVDKHDRVYLIDFDKTGRHPGDPDRLASIYRHRWCRAVRKHKLPEFLCTFMLDALSNPQGSRG